MRSRTVWDYGGPYLLDALWHELELDRFFLEALNERAFEQPVERALFALVAQRALAPDSKLACTRWAGSRAWISGLENGGQGFESQHFYRAMDFLFAAMPELQQHLYFQVTDLLNADVSVLFYDTTAVLPNGAGKPFHKAFRGRPYGSVEEHRMSWTSG